MVARAVFSITTAATVSLLAQQAQPPTIRSRTTLVPVDVRVVDLDGKPVTDLKKEDFTVLENGVRQDVRFFDTHALTAEPPRPGPPEMRKTLNTDTVTADSPLRAQNQRIFLFVFGRGRLQVPDRGLDHAIQFIKERLLPQDRVAVLAYNRATDFTTNRAAIVTTIERFKKAHDRIEADLKQQFSGLQAIYGGTTPQPSVQKEIDEIFHVAGTVNAGRLPASAPTDASQIAADRRNDIDTLQRQEVVEGRQRPSAFDTFEMDRAERMDMTFDEYAEASAQTAQDVGNIYTGINYLKYLDGEKHLVFVTEGGVFLPRLENDYSIAALASDARVVLDTLQTGGLITMNPLVRDPQGLTRVDPNRLGRMSHEQVDAGQTLRNLAAMTGGTASVYSPTDKALARIDAASRFEYLLAYVPSNMVWDGKFRRISVTVNRKNVRVLFRHGYYARDTYTPLDRRSFLTYNRIAAAANVLEPFADLRVTATADFKPGDGDVRVNLTLAGDRIKFSESDGRHQASLEIAYFAGNARQAIVGEHWQVVDLDLTEQNYETFKARGLSYTQRVPVKSDPVYVKVIAYDYAADALGSLAVRIPAK
jgi:VWFA-related protein